MTVLLLTADALAIDPVVRELLLCRFRQRSVRVVEMATKRELTAESIDEEASLCRRVLAEAERLEASVVGKRLRQQAEEVREKVLLKDVAAVAGEDVATAVRVFRSKR